MRRVALLGATGSIGRQALEVIDAHPELELCAAASGSRTLERPEGAHAGRRRPHGAPRGGAARHRPERRRRLRRAPGHAVDARARHRPRARQQGEPRRGGRSRDRGLGAGRRAHQPGGQRALGRAAVPGGPRAGDDRVARPHGLGRPVPRPGPARSRLGRAARGARPSHLEHGPEDQRRLGHAHEQGPRGDRGALPLRARVRADRGGRASDLDRARVRALPRRRLARARGLPGHARARSPTR